MGEGSCSAERGRLRFGEGAACQKGVGFPVGWRGNSGKEEEVDGGGGGGGEGGEVRGAPSTHLSF